MTKKLIEKFNTPKDWDFDNMLEEHANEYLIENNDSDDALISMDEFDEFFKSPWEAVRSAFFGGTYRGDFNNTHKESFNPTHDFWYLNGYGNAVSVEDIWVDDYYKDIINEEEFYNWCVEQGYFESEEDDE